jgi:hypothetical protein
VVLLQDFGGAVPESKSAKKLLLVEPAGWKDGCDAQVSEGGIWVGIDPVAGVELIDPGRLAATVDFQQGGLGVCPAGVPRELFLPEQGLCRTEGGCVHGRHLQLAGGELAQVFGEGSSACPVTLGCAPGQGTYFNRSAVENRLDYECGNGAAWLSESCLKHICTAVPVV